MMLETFHVFSVLLGQ